MRTHICAGRAFSAFVALGLVLSGCGSEQKSEPSSTSTPTTQSAPSSSAAPSSVSPNGTAAPPAGTNPTIADYIAQSGITEAPVKRGDPGEPTISVPLPAGWVDAGPKTPAGAYSAIVFADPAMATDPPTIIAIMSKLTGNVDPAEILRYAPGELKNLPGYESAGEGSNAKLGGFDAYQFGATYEKNGAKRLIAQKTVVIPARDGNGVFVLQLNAGGTEDQIGPLMDATSQIDEQTTITP